jgi:hypothetical protein
VQLIEVAPWRMSGTAPAFEFDFFLSRRGSIAGVAQEVADILEAEGFRVKLQDYDFAHGGRFVLDIHDALKRAQHLLILFSGDYDSSFWTREEFSAFLVAVAGSSGARRMGLLRCDAATPEGLLRGITFGDLHSVTDADQRPRIVLAVARGETPVARAAHIFGGTMPLENPLFLGRDELLAAMHAALSSGSGTAALTQAAVHGLGGVGKTSLARAYVARHEGDYAGVWWITAADRPGTLAGLSALAHALDPRLPADTPPEKAAEAALNAIAAQKDGPFLLVYDNAPDPVALKDLLPRRGARMIITSRHPDWGGAGTGTAGCYDGGDGCGGAVTHRATSQVLCRSTAARWNAASACSDWSIRTLTPA